MDIPQMICECLIETRKKKKKSLIPRWRRAPAMAVGRGLGGEGNGLREKS